MRDGDSNRRGFVDPPLTDRVVENSQRLVTPATLRPCRDPGGTAEDPVAEGNPPV